MLQHVLCRYSFTSLPHHEDTQNKCVLIIETNPQVRVSLMFCQTFPRHYAFNQIFASHSITSKFFSETSAPTTAPRPIRLLWIIFPTNPLPLILYPNYFSRQLYSIRTYNHQRFLADVLHAFWLSVASTPAETSSNLVQSMCTSSRTSTDHLGGG